MRTAVIADIHGNLTAFQAVLANIDSQKIDRIINLGDFIGYGPEPEAVAQLLFERQIPSILGNHEVALTNDAILNTFTENAYESLLITRQIVSDTTVAIIKHLPVYLIQNDQRFIHGAPPASVFDYITYYRLYELQAAFASTPEWLTFVGHTHLLGIYESTGQNIKIEILKKGPRRLRRQSKYIINVGSVGHPRDRNNAAKYVIFDDETDELNVRFIEYDVQRTVRLIHEIGLPKQNALRLL